MKSARVSDNAHRLDERVQQSQRIPTSGRIKAGIQIPYGVAAKQKDLVEAYNEGVSLGASFDDIKKHMQAIPGCPKTPLRPTNPAYFRAIQDDFDTPGAAQKLLDLYGEQRRGDPAKRIYTFPIAFATEDFDEVFIESFEAWKASGCTNWSEVVPGNPNMQCMTRKEAEKSQRQRWGGREIVSVRDCEPNRCEKFLSGACVHWGSLLGYIDQIEGAGPIECKFRSIYAAMGIMQTLDLVRRGLGHISGTHEGQPIFWVSKVLKNISRINPLSGKPERADHWLVRLSTPNISMVDLMREAEKSRLAMAETGLTHATRELLTDETTTVPESAHDVAPAPEPEEAKQYEQEDEQATAKTASDVVADSHDAPAQGCDEDVQTATEARGESAQETEQAAEKISGGEEKAAVSTLRRELGSILKTLEWGESDLGDYLDDNGYDKTSDMTQVGPLTKVLSELRPVVESMGSA